MEDLNEYLKLKLNRLLTLPTEKWAKMDWIHAAKLISREHSPDLLTKSGSTFINEMIPIRKSLIEQIQRKIDNHDSIDDFYKNSVGRPKVMTIQEAKRRITYIENQKQSLAKAKNIPIRKITDKEIAYQIAIEFLEDKNSKSTLSELHSEIIQKIKYARRLIRQDNK